MATSVPPEPGRDWRRWVLPVALGAIALWLLPFAGSSIYNHDEFTFLSHAKRMVAGEVPYRDFFEFIPPLSLWVLAALVALTGASIATAHAQVVLVVLIACAQLVGLARQLALPRHWAWLPAAFLAFGLFPHWGVWSHHWLVVPCELAALALAFRALGSDRARDWALAGVGVGASGLAVQSDGAAVGLALGAGLLLDAWMRRTPIATVARRSAALAAGAVAMVATCALALAAQGALADAYQDVVRWPMLGYRQAGGFNDVAYGADFRGMLLPRTPAPGWHVRVFHVASTYVLLPLAGLGALAWIAVRRDRAGWDPLRARFAMLGAWCLTAFWLALHGRCDYVHLSLAAVPAGLWLAVAAARAAMRGRLVPIGLVAAFLAAGALGQLKAMAKEPWIWTDPLHPDRRLEESEVIRYLRAHARPGDTIAAMPYGGFYYVYGPPPATRWTCRLPPVFHYGPPEEYAAFWAEIARRQPRFVVIAPWAWKRFGEAVADYARDLPPGYHRVGAFASPQWGRFKAVVYERP